MTEHEDDLTVVPLPSSETEEERRRIRKSNDRDQKLEREGKLAPHNVGYDKVVDLNEPKPDGVLDE